MVGTVEATLYDSSTCSVSVDGENLNSDVLHPSFCDGEQMPDRTQMSFSYRTFSESSGENNTIQMREAQTPYSSEDTHTNTHIMSGNDHNFSGNGHMDNFEGKAEPFFPKWRLPSKIRRKFTTTNKDNDCSMQEASETVENVNGDHVVLHSPKNNLRVCVDCNTTKTPLWRGGPQGPKSLCNACGIRYRKKRRALFASLNPDDPQSVPPKKRINLLHTGKKQNNKSSKSSSVGAGSNHLPLQVNKFFAFYHRHGFEKGMCGNTSSSIPNTTSHSAFKRRFAQEEEEAAKLLMAISYGLVYA
ncbi:hypothetical protein SUGI_0110640 [Cryptomeria japonica]|uniref:GATA transcription factor 21 n=1 Tax=Cryptomeria japonica TaxID=3369 RepID=UPI002408A1DD|nr:GATA transcription factor 21 [Cryptomeria japonica]GLJ09496.1 hypothetical protein SUGI_0110640 [Cryptomeria japonica]